MLENLTQKLQDTFRKLRSRGRLTDKDVDAALRDIRLNLLEADVNFKVVRDFVQRLKDRAVGEEILQSLSPDQQVVKIVNEELIRLLGEEAQPLTVADPPPSVYMLVGLQGTGKTTTAGKLALWARSQRKAPLLVATDIRRPAAIEQLRIVGDQVDTPVFELGTKTSAADIVRAAMEHAAHHGNDTVIVDTGGRLHIDEALMNEARSIKKAVHPTETLLVVDAMTGQDAVNAAQQFDSKVGVDGFILTKMDGDARGGAVLSIRAVTGKPVKFVGVGEKVEALEPFFPERMASRILGMGDVLTLIEKAESAISEEKALELERKLRRDQFGLDDFLEQIEQLKQMGSLDHLLSMIPGIGNVVGKGMRLVVDEGVMRRIQAIILSMTPEERRDPAILCGSRKRRIAIGSGTSPQEINQLLKQFKQMRKMMKQFGKRMPTASDFAQLLR